MREDLKKHEDDSIDYELEDGQTDDVPEGYKNQFTVANPQAAEDPKAAGGATNDANAAGGATNDANAGGGAVKEDHLGPVPATFPPARAIQEKTLQY